jgi:ubiquinone/menaquinone biosynthesis C-methylase UbiE
VEHGKYRYTGNLAEQYGDFRHRFSSLLHYDSQDIILDIGSGPGYLAAFLKDRVKEIHCLDTSQRYLEMCKDKLVGHNNVFVYKLNEDNYTDLSFLKDKTFS